MSQLDSFLKSFSNFLFESLKDKGTCKEMSDQELVEYCNKMAVRLHQFILGVHQDTDQHFGRPNNDALISDVLEEAKDLIHLISIDYDLCADEKMRGKVDDANLISFKKKQ